MTDIQSELTTINKEIIENYEKIDKLESRNLIITIGLILVMLMFLLGLIISF